MLSHRMSRRSLFACWVNVTSVFFFAKGCNSALFAEVCILFTCFLTKKKEHSIAFMLSCCRCNHFIAIASKFSCRHCRYFSAFASMLGSYCHCFNALIMLQFIEMRIGPFLACMLMFPDHTLDSDSVSYALLRRRYLWEERKNQASVCAVPAFVYCPMLNYLVVQIKSFCCQVQGRI